MQLLSGCLLLSSIDNLLEKYSTDDIKNMEMRACKEIQKSFTHRRAHCTIFSSCFLNADQVYLGRLCMLQGSFQNVLSSAVLFLF